MPLQEHTMLSYRLWNFGRKMCCHLPMMSMILLKISNKDDEMMMMITTMANMVYFLKIILRRQCYG